MLVQQRARNTMEAICTSKEFLNRTPAAQQLTERMNKWDYMKVKIFCTTKEMVSKENRPPSEWKKIFAGYTLDKRLITRIHREFKKINSPKMSEPIMKWTTELNRTFSKEEIQMAKKHMKNAHHLWP
jgi:hypothetical protein